jgi:hypothetical protein
MGHSTWSILTNVDKVHAGRPSHGEGGMPEAEIWWNVSALPVTWFRQFLPIDIATQYRGRLIVGVRSTARSESKYIMGPRRPDWLRFCIMVRPCRSPQLVDRIRF